MNHFMGSSLHWVASWVHIIVRHLYQKDPTRDPALDNYPYEGAGQGLALRNPWARALRGRASLESFNPEPL